jgi:hypothetical protein
MPAVLSKQPKKSSLRRAAKVSGTEKPTLWDRIGHLAGSIDGPGNLSTLSKTLPGYGRPRSR